MQTVLTFVIGLTVGYFLINALWIMRTQTFRLQRIMAFVLLFWALNTGKDLVLMYSWPNMDQVLEYVFIADSWSALPMVLLMLELSRTRSVNVLTLGMLTFPFLLFSCLYILAPSHLLITIYTVFLVVFGLAAVVVGSIRIHRYQVYIRNEYSNIDNINLSWFWVIVVMIAFLEIMWLVLSLHPSCATDTIYYIFTIAFWEVVLHFCRKLRPVLMPKEAERVEEEPEELPKDKAALLTEAIESLMKESRVYLQQDLRLEELALMVHTNRARLSRHFNEELQTTFYDYINRKRIEEGAIPMIKAHPEYKLEFVAQKSGFGSISTFRRAFLKITGKLPSEYLVGADSEGGKTDKMGEICSS